MALAVADLEALAKADVRSRAFPVELEAAVRQKFLDEGLIDEDDVLTTDGVEEASELQQKLARLKAGMPFPERKTKTMSLVNGSGWVKFSLFNQKWVTNKEIVFVAKKDELKGVADAPTEFRTKSKVLFDRCTKGKFVKAKPHTLQGEGISGTRWTWLSNDEQTVFVAIQLAYYDYVVSRWPSAEFMVEAPDRPVVVKIGQKGIKDGVAAWIAPIVNIKEPKGREDWNGKGEKVSGR